MRLFCLYMTRPDKRHPLLLWFHALRDAERTACSALMFTAQNYGHPAPENTWPGYKRALAKVRSITNEPRITVEIASVDIPRPRVGTIHINDRPVRVNRWFDPKANDLALRAEARRVHPRAG